MQGARCRVQGAGCRVQGAGCRVQVAGCRVQGSDPDGAAKPGRVKVTVSRRVRLRARVKFAVMPTWEGGWGVGAGRRAAVCRGFVG